MGNGAGTNAGVGGAGGGASGRGGVGRWGRDEDSGAGSRSSEVGGTAIEFDGVSVVYPKSVRPAVDGVSARVAPGSLVVLLGPSGCGKTTLLKTVNRLVEVTSGRVLVDGRHVGGMPMTDLRRRIGYVIQATGLFPHMTVAQNIGIVPRLLGWNEARRSARIDEMLELVDLGAGYRGRRPRQLSGGEAQRVGIARALAADPDFLLMDEPFGALDAITRVRLQEALLEILGRIRKTVLFVTHDVDEALKVADRIAVMREGRLVQVAEPLALLGRPADEFVGRLVGSDDVMRHLRLMRVADHMLRSVESGDVRDGDAPDVPAEADLGLALEALIRTGHDRLPVNAGNRLVGTIGFPEVRRAMH